MGTTLRELAREEGVRQGVRRALEIQLEIRFGSLPPLVQQRLDSLSATEVEALLLPVLTAQSLKELGLSD